MVENLEAEMSMSAIYPSQCNCGHLFLEKYEFSEITENGHIGFCWCGFCRTKVMVKSLKEGDKEWQTQQSNP